MKQSIVVHKCLLGKVTIARTHGISGKQQIEAKYLKICTTRGRRK